MSGDQLEEAEVDRLGAAVFEQRRLSHMLRQRGAEIEALQSDRERLGERERKAHEREEGLRWELGELEQRAISLRSEIASLSAGREREAAELKRAQYEMRRAERRLVKAREEGATNLAKAEDEAAANLAKAEDEAAEERRRAERRLEEARAQLSSLTANRDSVVTELKRAEYETRRAGRRVAKVEREAVEASRRNRLQLDALGAELRAGLASRDEALKREQRVLGEREEALGERDEVRGERDEARGERDEALGDRRRAYEAFEQAQVEAAEAARGVETSALELGRAQREVELLAGLEKEREVVLADSEQTLGEVAEHLRRVRASRSWRWGHAIAQALRALTFRRRSGRSALDNALQRLGDDEPEPPQDERRI
ncbi:MAG: hypothetical protein WA687_09260 [Solirubrobacterales bacterium]